MLACPNVNTKEWKDLEKAIGQREAFREYIKLGDGNIPRLIDVLPLNEVPFSKLEDDESVKTLREDTANDLIDFLNNKFPAVKGAVINDKKQKWKGKLVDGKTPTINLAYAEASDGFHEFSHPFLMALRKSNPETFNSLYDDLKNSEEWTEISGRATERVNKLYPELRGNINLDLYKEEVMATAIGYAAELKLTTSKKKISSRLGRVIDSIFKWLNSFFAELTEKGFANRIKTNDISPNTTFGEIVDMFTDTRSQIILDSNWDKAVDNLRIADAMTGALTTNQELMSEQLINDMSVDILTNKAFNLDEYINDWLFKNFKIPKKEFVPRKVKPSELAYNVAKSMVQNVQQKGFQLKGIDFKKTKQLPEKFAVNDQFAISNKTIEKLASVLNPIELNYKFSNYLTNKKATSIALNQPLVTIKDIETKDKEGNVVIQPTPNIQMSVAEAEAVIDFQNFIKDKFPGRKSMPADEINKEYLDWVTENYGINWIDATGHAGYGMDRITNAVFQNYTRVLFIDDYFDTSPRHTFTVNQTGDKGNGLGWYASVTIQGDRFDHEFQSDILPEIERDFKQGKYSESLPAGQLRPQNRRRDVGQLALLKINKMIEMSRDFLIARDNFLYGQIIAVDEETRNFTPTPIEVEPQQMDIQIDELPFSKLDSYDPARLENSKKFLLSEVNVQIAQLKTKGSRFNSVLFQKGYLKLYNLFLSRKNDQQKELFDWYKTFKVTNVDNTKYDTDDTIDLPFSKTDDTPVEIYLQSSNEKNYYLTQESIDKFPSFFKQMYKTHLEWAQSNAPIKPDMPNNEMYLIRNIANEFINTLVDKDGSIKKNYGTNKTKIKSFRDRAKEPLDKLFKSYAFYKKQLKGLEWRQTVYQDVNNIVHIAEYYKGQFNRFYRFYNSVYESALPIAEEQIKAKDRDPNYARYKKYNDLYYKWFDIIVPQSINSAKAEGRPYYYLPTAMAMNAIENNPNAEKVYWTPSDSLEEVKRGLDPLKDIERYVSQNTEETTAVIRQYLTPQILSRYNQDTTPLQIAEDLYGETNFESSDEFNKFLLNSPNAVTKPNGPFYNALVRYARKNNIKLTFETPSWAKQTLIKVDLTGYTIKPIDRFSKIDPEQVGKITPEVSIEQQQKQEIGQNIVMAVAGRMMNNLGVNFNIVTAEQARKITEGAKNPWNGEKAFFFNGQTYFLSEGFTTENVLHEYSHPLIDAIFATNKELFNRLYDVLSSSEEGMKIIDEVAVLYPEVKSTDPIFRKEVIVRALAAEAQNKINDVPLTKEFKNFIERAIFAIKQALRKVFGTKVKVEKLSTDTTLKQLADMLVSEQFEIDTELITDKDYVEYLRNIDDLTDSLKNVEDSDLSLTIDRFYQLTTRQIFQVMKNKNYAEARKILINEETQKGLLQEIKATLESTAEIDEKIKELLDDIQIREKNAKNFVHSINRLDILTSAVADHMRELIKKEDNQEVLNSVFYYDLLVRNWSKFIEETNQRLFDAGMDEKSELGKMLSSIQTSLDTTKRLIREAYTPGVFEVLKNTLKPLAEDIDRMYKEQLEKARKANAPQRAIDDIQKKWDDTKLTDERIMDLLLGEAGDTNPVSAYLEAYTNSPDPIIGGFAMFLKNAYTDVDVEAQRNANNFMRDMAPLLEAAGYSRSNFTKLMEKLAFLDEMTYFNSESGKLEKKKVWTFLNEFMNVDSQVKQYNYDYEQALENGDQAEADRILKEKRKHLREYFNQEYTDEYYAREDVYDSLEKNKDLEDAVYKVMGVDKTKATTAEKAQAAALYDKAAKEAYRRKQLILSEIKELDGLNYDEKYYDEVAEQKSLLWRRYSRIASLRDVNGQPKFGEELLVALIEKKYRKVSNDIFEWKPITGQFDFALERYEQSLIDGGIAQKSEEFKEKRKKWIKDNTVIKYTDEFYKQRNETLSKLKRLLNEIKKRNPNLVERIDSTEEIEQMLDLALGFRDQNGQIIADDISDLSKNRFRDLQEAINKKKESYAGFSGLTASEDRELSEIFERLKNKTATAQDRVRLNELMEIKNELGIDKATQLQLQKLYKDLAEIQSKEATDYYVEQLNDWLTHMGESPVDNDTASSVLSPEMYTKLFKASPEFEKWFKENHIRKEVYDKKQGETIITYERLFIWNRTRPNDPEHFQKFKLNSGEEIPGVPTLSYYYRTVKDKYKTQKVVGKNVDNRGRFLPKTLGQGAPFDSPYINKQYEELRNSDPAAFKVLEKMKEYHLKWQETTPFESRLYMQVPRYRSMASENMRDIKEKTISRSRRLYRNIRDVFIGSKDNYQDGLNFEKAGQLVDADMFDEEIRKIPITGLYDLKPEEVSMNFLDSMLRYMHSGLKQKKLVELNPFAQALKSVVEDPNNAIKISGKFIKNIYKKTGRKVPIREKGQSVRSKAISNLYDREFKGIRINDFTKNMPAAWKLKSAASKITSLGAFALNIPSALKNRQGAIVQGLIEASGGRWMSAQSYILGKGRAWKMMSALSSQVYATKNRSLDVQLMQIFDPSQDFTKRSIETQFGRSLLDDAANLSILMAPRKFLQLEATLEVMCGMLYHIKVPQTINGQTREVEYINAFEIKNGQIELKEGIDPEWAPGGSKFKEVKNKIHEVGNRLEGTYGEFDAAEIDRTFFGSAIKFMKKFFTSMFMNWFGMERKSVALGTVSSGNYIGFLNIMGKILKYGPRSVMWSSESDMAGFRKTLTQIAVISFHYMILSYLFGYDPDDEERFAKMRAREKESWGGWIFNHGALLTLGTLTETETWSHPYIFYYTAKDLASPKHLYDMYLKKPFDFVDHSIGVVTGDKGSFYKQDSGPYWYQKEGAPKVIADVAKVFGFTGSAVSPAKGMKSTEDARKGLFK
jgi:uncharacterized protein YoxC